MSEVIEQARVASAFGSLGGKVFFQDTLVFQVDSSCSYVVKTTSIETVHETGNLPWLS